MPSPEHNTAEARALLEQMMRMCIQFSEIDRLRMSLELTAAAQTLFQKRTPLPDEDVDKLAALH